MDKREQDLLKRFSQGEETEKEKEVIKHWLHHLNEEGASGLSEDDLLTARAEMWENVKPVHKLSGRNRILRPLAVAAMLLLTVSAGVYFYKVQQDANQPILRQAKNAHVIKPGSNKAVLILADGKRIILNDAANGELAEQSGIRISKAADGQLIYSVTDAAVSAHGDAKIAYNTIETPRGGQYQVNLPDGSTVWLNALSSLRFPTRFSNNERRVELSGEGYFEISHNRNKPFRVKTNRQEVEVLGTHFNINAYSDETATKTTLLEGSVKVLKLNSQLTKLLKPNQQSVLTGDAIDVNNVDAEASIDWKKGYFRFDDESLESIMRKVSRWYNVDVVYQNEGLKHEPFAGIITRFAKVSDLLKMLELTGEVKFTIEDNHIIVKEKS